MYGSYRHAADLGLAEPNGHCTVQSKEQPAKWSGGQAEAEAEAGGPATGFAAAAAWGTTVTGSVRRRSLSTELSVPSFLP